MAKKATAAARSAWGRGASFDGAPATSSEDGAALEVSSGDEGKRDNKPRIWISLTDDRSDLDWESMRESTRDAVRRALSGPQARRGLGLVPAGAAESKAELDPMVGATVAGAIYEASSKVLIAVALRAGYTPNQAAVLRFTDEEKSSLAGPTSAVLAKYLPAVQGQYQEELVLALLLVTILSGKITALQAASSAPAAALPVAVN